MRDLNLRLRGQVWWTFEVDEIHRIGADELAAVKATKLDCQQLACAEESLLDELFEEIKMDVRQRIRVRSAIRKQKLINGGNAQITAYCWHDDDVISQGTHNNREMAMKMAAAQYMRDNQ